MHFHFIQFKIVCTYRDASIANDHTTFSKREKMPKTPIFRRRKHEFCLIVKLRLTRIWRSLAARSAMRVYFTETIFAVACADSGRVAPARADSLLTREARTKRVGLTATLIIDGLLDTPTMHPIF